MKTMTEEFREKLGLDKPKMFTALSLKAWLEENWSFSEEAYRNSALKEIIGKDFQWWKLPEKT